MAPPETTPSAEPTLTELLALVDALRAEVAQLRAENQVLKDEIARLKGLPPRPPFKPSGMDKATPLAGKRRAKRGRGVKRLAATEEQVVPASVPAGARFKGYEDVLVQDLAWSVRVIRYRRERWLTPDGETVVAPLPAGVVGGFGPGLRRFLLAGHIAGQVTSERLTALVTGLGLSISKRQVVRLLTTNLACFATEEQAVLRARFDRIFQRKTGYAMLDRLLARLHRRKHELLRVLDRPEIPLHTNGSENDIRACVTKRKISGGTMSDNGRRARDVLLGLMKTCRKLGLSFVEYLGDRLAVPGTPTIPPLPDLVRHAAKA